MLRGAVAHGRCFASGAARTALGSGVGRHRHNPALRLPRVAAAGDTDPEAAGTHLAAVPEPTQGTWGRSDTGKISYRDSRSRAGGKRIYPLCSGGTTNICRTSALLDPAVRGQGEVVAPLTHVPSSCRARGAASLLHHPPGAAPSPPKNCSIAPSPSRGKTRPNRAGVHLLPSPHGWLRCHHSRSLTNSASPAPTRFLSETLRPKLSPLRTCIFGDRRCSPYLGFAQGLADHSWDAQI